MPFPREYFPGLLAAITVALAASFLAEHYGGPAMLFALLLGIAFQSSVEGSRCATGVAFASSAVLRLGVALLGLRITLDQILALGAWPLFLVVGAVTATICLGLALAWAGGRDWTFGVLTGGAVAICGAAAAMAIASVLPKSEQSERHMLFAVVAVTSLSTVAMVVYPVLTSILGFDDFQAGIFVGATIHDVAQVVGAGYAISDEAGDAATLIKMLRVIMLAPFVVLLAALVWASGRTSAGRASLMPWFVVLFAGLVVVNSAGLVPAGFAAMLETLSRLCLITAIAALGLRTSLKSLFALGSPALAVIVAETVFLALLVGSVLVLL